MTLCGRPMNVTNYFENRLSAERYAAARPDVHGIALSRFAAFTNIDLPVGEALDVGCGTGQSTLALAQHLARHVVGIDPSEPMLAACGSHPNVEFKCSDAENIPAIDATYDLVVVAQAFHWLNQTAFLREAIRVLKDAGWLLIYNAWFTAEMKESAAFSAWFKEQYLRRYPTPPRQRTAISNSWANENGFLFFGEESFSLEVPMTLQRFTDYQLSTTNVIAAVKGDKHLFEEAQAWIAKSLEMFFNGETERTFLFAGTNWYLQKRAA